MVVYMHEPVGCCFSVERDVTSWSRRRVTLTAMNQLVEDLNDESIERWSLQYFLPSRMIIRLWNVKKYGGPTL